MLSFFIKRRKDPRALLIEALGERDLPSFPGAVLETMKLLRDPDATAPQIGRSIEINPGLAVKVLSMVNSAAFALRRRVDNVGQAITLLGRSRVESLVVAGAVRGQLPNKPAPGFDPVRFWTAAARRASVSRALAKRLHPQTQAESFIAGLLQDMAVPLLVDSRPEVYGDLLSEWHSDADSRLEALERAELGWDHPEIGASMAARWDLPEHLILAVGGHHAANDDELDVPHAVQLVGLIREGDDDPEVERLVEACRDHGMRPDDTVKCVGDAYEAAGEIARLMA